MENSQEKESALKGAAKIARLPLTAERLSILEPFMAGVLESLVQMNAVELKETTLSLTYDSRWRK